MNGNGMLKNVKQVTIFPSFDLFARIEKYWHKHALPNRSTAIIKLIERGLEAEKKKGEEEK